MGLVIAIIIILVGAVAAGAYYYCKEIKPKIRVSRSNGCRCVYNVYNRGGYRILEREN